MDRIILSLECEGSGFILLSATEDPRAASGWFMNGPAVSLISVSEDFAEGTNYFDVLTTIREQKDIHLARLSHDKKLITVCKRQDDITIKIIEFNVVDIASTSSSSTALESLTISRALESHLAAAQSQLASQSSELASLRQRCAELAAKFGATVDEAADSRDRLLAAFCRVLNAKKARIAELTTTTGAGDEEDDDDGDESVEQSSPSRKVGGGGGGKRKSPTAAAAAAAASTTSQKPGVRRTRSSAKKPRGAGGDD